MMRKTTLILLGAAAGAALTLITTQPRLVFDPSSARAAAADTYRQLSLFGDVFERVRADYVEKLPYVDRERMAAAGASFGGYMMNWFAVNTGRFKTLISHCGVWNFESMYLSTD